MKITFNKFVVLTFSILGALAGQAHAAEKTVTVDSKARPWDVGANPKLYYGISGRNGKAPVYVLGIRLLPGSKLKFFASGETTTFPGGGAIGPDGDKTFVTNGRYGNPGAYFPSLYFEKSKYPAYLNELVGAFVDADGVVIDQPFPIGVASEVVVPKGAVSLSMGINDDNLNDNSGSILVRIEYLIPNVIVEEVDGR